ncbi:MAG: hypothetical protein NTX65_04845 [Ignavibacteriales bacterium]|nr:hypothetical protein [Ignavibacteriales bacterium]
MSVPTKNKLKVWSKRASVVLFAMLFLLNIKIAFTDDLSDGDISLFGMKLTLFQATSALEADPRTGLTYMSTPGGTIICCLHNASTAGCAYVPECDRGN